MNPLQEALERRRRRRAKLPWRDLEADAARQGVSPADIFFDRAGRPVPGLTAVCASPVARKIDPGPDGQGSRAPAGL